MKIEIEQVSNGWVIVSERHRFDFDDFAAKTTYEKHVALKPQDVLPIIANLLESK